MKQGLVLLLVALPGFHAHAESIRASTEQPAKPWTSLSANDAPADFRFVVVTDRTGNHRPGVFASAMAKINALEPAFVLSVGDLIEGYTQSTDELNAQWDEFQNIIAQLDAPFFYAPGNHDMSNAVMSETWRSRFGPSYYHFVYKDVLFLVINSELFGMVGNPMVAVPGPWHQSEQMRFIERILTEHADARWTMVVIHQPLWDSPRIHPDWLRVEDLLGERNYTVFAGHRHRYVQTVRRDRKYITLATTGGSSALRGPLYGEFDHIALVSMTDSGPTIANLTLEGILGDDVRTEVTRDEVARLTGAVRAEPGYFPGARFSAGELRYRVANRGDAPLTAVPYVTGNALLRWDGEPTAVMVPPGGEEQVSLRFKAPRPAAFETLAPARVSWSLTSQIQQQPVVLELHTAALPLREFPVRRLPHAVVLDGAIEEWRLPYRVARQGDIAGPQIDPRDVSYRFGVGYDEQHFYLAADVLDDSLVSSPARALLDQDALVISVDARPDPERSQNESLDAALGNGNLGRMAVDVVAVDPPANDDLLDFLSDTRSRLTSRARRTDGGYTVEIAVPVALLDAWHGGAWQAVRVDLFVNDFDVGESGSQPLHWQPYRFGPAPVVGSGTFVRR